ncbi:MAG: TolB family protein, partial [Thermodesulfobacteriota bacterium]
RIYIRDRQAGTTTAILAYGGAAPNASIDNPAMAGDGSAVAFQSTASNLLAADNPGGTSNIFVYDTASGSIDLISRSYGSSLAETITPTYGANSGCEAPSISYGGRYVAFLSAATNLIYGAGNGYSQVYVYDRTTGEMVIASAQDGGTGLANNSNYTPNISNDGRYVAFSSWAGNLTPTENPGDDSAVYLRDLVDQKTTLISRIDNTLAGYGSGVYGTSGSDPVVSACGMYVAFASSTGYLAEPSGGKIFLAINDTNGDGIADTDADGDGTPDCADLCPDDPDKIEPGACGCGVADTDTDGDGTPDCLEEEAAPLLPDTATQPEDAGVSCFISTAIN